jgi:TatD DNase family protein
MGAGPSGGGPLYDSHAHLDTRADPDAAVARALSLGIDRILVPAIDPARWDAVAALRDRHPCVRIAIGIHPAALDGLGDDALERALAELAERASALGAVAIGECGIDGRLKTPLDRQLRTLGRHIEVARALDLPVVLHVVHADAIALERVHGVRGALHGFTGAPETARRWIARGMLVGLGARVLDPSARRVRASARELPLSALSLETDDADVAQLDAIAAEVAALRGVSPEEVRRATHQNASRLFDR